MRNHPSVFDYSLVISRKNRCLVIESPDFGYRFSAPGLALDALDPEQLGRAVLSAWGRIHREVLTLEQSGDRRPRPRRIHLQSREYLSTREAASALGISAATLRKRARRGELPAERLSGGRFRFPMLELAEYVASHVQTNPIATEEVA